MSDRINEYHGDEAKVLTTDEVERWQEFLGDGIQLRRTLATTRALEKLEEGLRLWHGTPPDERARLAIDKAGELWRSAVERAEKAEAERDEARATVADLVDASERLLEHYSDWIPDHLVDEFRAALAKAKGTK